MKAEERAAELREALVWQHEFNEDIRKAAGRKWAATAEAGIVQLAIVCDAARERLAQLEGDPELVERMREVVVETVSLTHYARRIDADRLVRELLNALTTSTDEEA